MNYFKNTELAGIYPVSEKAVRNWIKSVKEGKLALALYENKGKQYIANTPKNLAIIEDLVQKRKKFANKQASKVVKPQAEFYKWYTKSQAFDIINNIEYNKEIPLKYSYFENGAQYWNDYVKQVIENDIPSIPTTTSYLLDLNNGFLEGVTSEYDRVNIICLGAESHMSLKKFLLGFLGKGKLGRYIVIDISEGLLKLARKDVANWTQGAITPETYQRDMDYDRFNDLLEVESLRSQKTINIVLQIGSTIYNGRSPSETLHTIRRSMSGQDIFIHDLRLGKYARFGLNHGLVGSLTPRHRLAVDLLGIHEDLYSIEHYYDEKLKVRLVRIRLKVALTVEFDFPEGQRKVHFYKSDVITVFRYWHNTYKTVFRALSEANFNLLLANQTEDLEYLLTISNVKNDS